MSATCLIVSHEEREFIYATNAWIFSKIEGWNRWIKYDLLNIQMDHIPINLHMSGSFDGNRKLKERAPPNSIDK